MAIQIRRGTKAEFLAGYAANIVVGEFAFCTDTEELYIGTGDGTYIEVATGAEVTELVGNLASLVTTDKSNVVAAINEVAGTIPSPSSEAPKKDGTASPGSANTWSRSDHVHPTDDSRASAQTLATRTAIHLGTDGDGRFCIITE